MKKYEAMLILKPDLEKEELNDLCQKIVDNIKKYNGEIEDAQEWGRRQLAYKIKGCREGTYYLLKFKAPPAQIAPINADFKLNESIIRALITDRKN